MIVDISTSLPAAPDVVQAHLKTSRLFSYVAFPFVTFVASESTPLPEIWTEGAYQVSMRIFGLIPLGKQAIVISFPNSPDSFRMRDNGHSRLIKKWDHIITLNRSGEGTHYQDHVTIEAGAFTPVVWLFARSFFRHRQRRWRQLVASGFNYESL